MLSPDVKKAIVRVRNHSDKVVGAGFFVTQEIIATCAHVIEDALGKSTGADLIGKIITVDMAFETPTIVLKAEIITWKNNTSEMSDLALLRIIGSQIELQLPNLDSSDISTGMRCQTYGFPVNDDDGLHAVLEVVDTTSEGLIQLEASKAVGQIVEEGYSGAPVWSQTSNVIIGMIVSAKKKNTLGLAIPARFIGEQLKNLTTAETFPVKSTIPEKRLDSLLKLMHDYPDPVLFLGAGASHKSGIPLTDDLVARAAREAFGREHDRYRDPTIRRSDWLEWLESLDWYDSRQTPSDQYVPVMNNLFTDEDRILFLRQVCQPEVEPGVDYKHIVRLLGEQRIFTLFTTNFDDTLTTLLHQVSNPPSYHVAGPHRTHVYDRISTAPRYPQIIQIFGNYEYYAVSYFSNGYKQLDASLHQIRNQIVALFRDHPIIVVGYSGKETCVIDDLFLANLKATNQFQKGLYWCVWEGNTELHPNVIRLSKAVGRNFSIVKIPSHDYLIEKIVNATTSLPIRTSVSPKTVDEPVTEDMRVVSDVGVKEFDWSEIKSRLPEYCRKTKIPLPTIISDEWIQQILVNQDFARIIDGKLVPTVAGYLLFGSNEIIREKHPSISIELRVGNEPPSFFRGNLWHQLKLVDILETEFNQPYRLKGLQSETVTPYPSLALKELVVNALAHRQYLANATQNPTHVVVSVGEQSITITNPGGLLQTVYQQLPPDKDPEHYLGHQVLKGYRNPVIAHFLYSTGDMDRLGSGLVDVRKWVRHNEGNVTFRVGDDFFEVTIYKRADTIDEKTGAAQQLKHETRFISNLFEVTRLPDLVWSANTEYRYVPNILKKVEGRLPAFVLYDGRLFTFSDLLTDGNPLSQFIDKGTVVSEKASQLFSNENGYRRFVNLLNQALASFFRWETEIIFDWQRKRAYFIRDAESEEKKISYQGRVRRAERTVVKARKSQQGKVVYWEHRAVELYFEKFGETWAVQILPTYVFTKDGYRDFLAGDRSGPMATRKLSREYNQHVDNDLTFWSRILSTSDTEIEIEKSYGSYLSLRNFPTDIILKGSPLGIDNEHESEISPELDELEEDLEEQLLAEEYFEDEDGSDN